MQATKGQRATLPAEETQNAKNLANEKETTETLVLVAYDAGERKRKQSDEGGKWARSDDGMDSVVTARWYMGRSSSASTVYCSVWVTARGGEPRWFSGHGDAGGYGYCKQSAAFAEAVRSAGIKLATDCGGAGMTAVHEAMHAIAKACGYGRCPRAIV